MEWLGINRKVEECKAAITKVRRLFAKLKGPRLRKLIRAWNLVNMTMGIARMLMLVYVSLVPMLSHERPARPPQENTPATPSLVGHTGTTIIDVNLRERPGDSRKKTGVIKRFSRVRIIDQKGAWVEVIVVQKRQKGSPDRGWTLLRHIQLKDVERR